MKFRIGFVSNSSTSSFLIYGAIIKKDLFLRVARGLGSQVEDGDEAAREFIWGKLAKHLKGLEAQCGPDYDNDIYVGLSWSEVKDDETGKEFKDTIEKQIKELFGEYVDEEIEFHTYEKAWRDG